ncbi:MAG TPA: Fe-S cluster assembly protein NifU, partial [Elusimicrobiales bacterium]|nr:Fe-S cluster assembly protein NifU [Elusimicrobiales bacterium]
VKDHFRNPRNTGEIENADGTGNVGNLICGDALKLTLKVDKETEKILDAKFKTFGCGSAIASSSALTEIIKGKTIEEAANITNQDIADYLGGLPPEKMHCSVMGREALEAAIKSYRSGGKPVDYSHEPGNIICKCFGITEEKIVAAIKESKLKTVEEVTNFTKAGGACGKCKGDIQKILDKLNKFKCETPDVKPKFSEMTHVAKIHTIEDTLRHVISPRLIREGGDIEFVDLEGSIVKVKLKGTCKDCSSSDVTLKNFVENELQKNLDKSLKVEEIK